MTREDVEAMLPEALMVVGIRQDVDEVGGEKMPPYYVMTEGPLAGYSLSCAEDHYGFCGILDTRGQPWSPVNPGLRHNTAGPDLPPEFHEPAVPQWAIFRKGE